MGISQRVVVLDHSQQILEMAIALLLHPRLLMVDQPSLGLDPQGLVEIVFDTILTINPEGTTVLMVEQNAKKALSVSRRCFVLELGRKRFEGTGAEFLNDPDVRQHYLGGSPSAGGVLAPTGFERVFERGRVFARYVRTLVLVVSCAIGATSAVTIGLEIQSVAHHQAYRLAHDRREGGFQAWLAQQPVSTPRPRTTHDEVLDVLRAPGTVMETLRWEHARRNGLEDFVNPPHPERGWWDWPIKWVVLLGIAVAMGVTAVPWGFFYLVRSIVRGFSGA